jgi:hypothetical protein
VLSGNDVSGSGTVVERQFKCQDIELVGSPVTAGTVMGAVTTQPEYLYIYQTAHSCSCVDANKERQGIKVTGFLVTYFLPNAPLPWGRLSP